MVRYGDTGSAPVDPGAGGSRVTHVIGQAALDGGQRHASTTLEDLAAEAFGWPAGEVRLERDRFVAGAESASFDEVALRIGQGPPVTATGAYAEAAHGHDEPGDFNASGLRRRGRGRSRRRARCGSSMRCRWWTSGTIINPLAHQGQLQGGFAFGVGAALMEDLQVADGQVTTLTLGDYKLPSVMDMPPLRTVLLTTEVGPGPFGAKAVGEVTNSGVPPADSQCRCATPSVRG